MFEKFWNTWWIWGQGGPNLGVDCSNAVSHHLLLGLLTNDPTAVVPKRNVHHVCLRWEGDHTRTLKWQNLPQYKTQEVPLEHFWGRPQSHLGNPEKLKQLKEMKRYFFSSDLLLAHHWTLLGFFGWTNLRAHPWNPRLPVRLHIRLLDGLTDSGELEMEEASNCDQSSPRLHSADRANHPNLLGCEISWGTK